MSSPPIAFPSSTESAMPYIGLSFDTPYPTVPKTNSYAPSFDSPYLTTPKIGSYTKWGNATGVVPLWGDSPPETQQVSRGLQAQIIKNSTTGGNVEDNHQLALAREPKPSQQDDSDLKTKKEDKGGDIPDSKHFLHKGKKELLKSASPLTNAEHASRIEANVVARSVDSPPLDSNTQQVLDWQLFTSKIIFWVVIVLVLLGTLFSGIQFSHSLRVPPKGKGNSEDVQIEASLSGVKLKSSLIGVVIFVISYMFFFLYLVYVYPIQYVK